MAVGETLCLIRKTVCQGGAEIRAVRLELPWGQGHSAVSKQTQGQVSSVQPLCDLRAKPLQGTWARPERAPHPLPKHTASPHLRHLLGPG